jgi:hypothetical protein
MPINALVIIIRLEIWTFYWYNITMPEVVDLKKPVSKKENAAPARSGEDKNDRDAFQPVLWQAGEFDSGEKERGWHLALVLITVAVVALMILYDNYTAVVLFMILAMVIYIYSKKEPRILDFGVTERGVKVGDRVYVYSELISFWIFYDKKAGRSELSLRSRKALMPYIRIPLGDTNPATVHKALTRFMPEIKQRDSLTDAWARRVGF